jgi:hypothetical protein
MVVGTVSTIRHPGFDETTLSNDLALVQLSADAPTQPALLLRETMSNSPGFVGPNFSFVGYGLDDNNVFGVRRVVSFPIQRIGPANDVGLDTHSGPIDATQFYFRIAGKNTCQGDSGGPAFTGRAHVERVAGVTSTGDSACLIDGVDARTDLPEIAAFIQPTIDRFEGMDPCRGDGFCNETCNQSHRLVDPDCAPNHCSADGICALACIDPPDPDCPASPCSTVGACTPTDIQAPANVPALPLGWLGTYAVVLFATGAGTVAQKRSRRFSPWRVQYRQRRCSRDDPRCV